MASVFSSANFFLQRKEGGENDDNFFLAVFLPSSLFPQFSLQHVETR